MKKKTLMILTILLTAAFSGVEMRAQSAFADNTDSGLVRDAFDRALGRAPKPKEIDDWKAAVGWGSNYGEKDAKARLNDYEKIVRSLKTYLAEPSGEAELIGVIKRSYARSVKREPRPDEYLYWKKEIYAKKFGYEDLMNFQRAWLKSEKGFADRAYVIMQGYLDGIGRAPSPSDSAYWQNKIKTDGTNYTELVARTAQYILTDAGEFSATVKRAFAIAKMPAPDADTIAEIRIKIQNKPRDFAQMVELVKNWKTTKKID